MGAVALEERTTGLIDRGSPVTEATLYIYCDSCGSFNIKTYIPFIKLLILAIIGTLSVFLIWGNKQWLACVFPLGWWALFIPWKDILLRYKCRKCGNIHISEYNSLSYQSYDLSVVDVPDHLTQKRYIDTDVVHFQQFTSKDPYPPHPANSVRKDYNEKHPAESRELISPTQHSPQQTAEILHASQLDNSLAENPVPQSLTQHNPLQTVEILRAPQEVTTHQPSSNQTMFHQCSFEDYITDWMPMLLHQNDGVIPNYNKMERYNLYNHLLYPEQKNGNYKGKGKIVVNEPTADEYNVLLTLLAHKKARVRWMAACWLGKIRDEQAVQPLIRALTDKHWMVRLHAAQALGCIYTSICFEPLVATIHDSCIYVRRAAMFALEKAQLGKAPLVIEALLTILQGSDECSQVDVIRYLKYAPSPTVIHSLTEAAFHDQNYNISREVLSAFATIGSPATIGVGKLLEHPNKDARYHAAIILGYRGDKRAIQYMEAILESADSKTRERAKFYLSEFRKRYPELQKQG